MTDVSNIRHIVEFSDRILEQVARQAIEAAEKDGNKEKAARLQRILDGYLAEASSDEWPF